MSDFDTLRQRIEQAELRLKTAHAARQRESAALTSMWDQIRTRFSAQSAEIVRLRGRVALLEDTRDELQGMIRTLLGSVESSIERMSDETVPRITGLAEELLDSALLEIDPDSETAAAPLPEPAPARAVAERTAPPRSPRDDFAALLSEQFDGDEIPDPPMPEVDDDSSTAAVSPGIRSLITRIEGAFEHSAAPEEASSSGDPDGEGDEALARDLDDIRRLREELQSLRTRIGATG